jgi:YD repeat-containing protein
VNYTYDADGNLLSNGVNTYAYDSADRLISVSNQSSVYSYQYDGLGQWLSMSGEGVTTQYVLDYGQMLEATAAGTHDRLPLWLGRGG